MTPEQALDLLRQLRALERLQQAVQAMTAPEWFAARIAFDDRIRLLRYCLTLEDPALVAAAAERYDHERDQERRMALPATAAPQLPHLASGRIH